MAPLTTIEAFRAARRVHELDLGGGRTVRLREPTIAETRLLREAADAEAGWCAFIARLVIGADDGPLFPDAAAVAEHMTDADQAAVGRWLVELRSPASAEKNSPPPAAPAGGSS